MLWFGCYQNHNFIIVLVQEAIVLFCFFKFSVLYLYFKNTVLMH